VKVSRVVEQRWTTDGERWVLYQGERRVAEVIPHEGRWLSREPTTARGLHGDGYDDRESAGSAESDRAAARVLDQLSAEAKAVLRAAGLLT
jgi:hypothetical protein